MHPIQTSRIATMVSNQAILKLCHNQATRAIHTEFRLAERGFKLPRPNSPKGTYIQLVRHGNLIYTAGHLPQPRDGGLVRGKIGYHDGYHDDNDVDTSPRLTVKQGYQAAQYCGLSILSTLKAELGDLDKVERVIKVVGFVNCHDTFHDQPAVINGCSDLFGEILQERGIHARAALGTNALPLGVAVEIEAIIQVKD